ncbi:hypothetical protein CEXT_62561 [Caerostris extrusa]|uniref:Uncharacterized protein n=1 Tax=Caerostris extrusa TaxID=172846 RepID=A0AAV4M6Y0_CAEEX|nr:hypothetical protein CEXT_62561 [Caerostris extrusa]
MVAKVSDNFDMMLVISSGQSDTGDLRASHDSTELLGLPSVISKTTIAKPADISYKTTIDHMVPSSASAGSSSMNYAGYGIPSSGLLNVPCWQRNRCHIIKIQRQLFDSLPAFLVFK